MTDHHHSPMGTTIFMHLQQKHSIKKINEHCSGGQKSKNSSDHRLDQSEMNSPAPKQVVAVGSLPTVNANSQQSQLPASKPTRHPTHDKQEETKRHPTHEKEGRATHEKEGRATHEKQGRATHDPPLKCPIPLHEVLTWFSTTSSPVPQSSTYSASVVEERVANRKPPSMKSGAPQPYDKQRPSSVVAPREEVIDREATRNKISPPIEETIESLVIRHKPTPPTKKLDVVNETRCNNLLNSQKKKKPTPIPLHLIGEPPLIPPSWLPTCSSNGHHDSHKNFSFTPSLQPRRQRSSSSSTTNSAAYFQDDSFVSEVIKVPHIERRLKNQTVLKAQPIEGIRYYTWGAPMKHSAPSSTSDSWSQGRSEIMTIDLDPPSAGPTWPLALPLPKPFHFNDVPTDEHSLDPELAYQTTGMFVPDGNEQHNSFDSPNSIDVVPLVALASRCDAPMLDDEEDDDVAPPSYLFVLPSKCEHEVTNLSLLSEGTPTAVMEDTRPPTRPEDPDTIMSAVRRFEAMCRRSKLQK